MDGLEIFDLYRLGGPHANLVRRYCYMLDQDYNHNKVVVSGYLHGLLSYAEKAVSHLAKGRGKSGAFGGMGRDSIG